MFFLISAGAKVERSDEMEDICRALILAAFRGDLVNLRQLYLAQIDMNYQDYNKRYDESAGVSCQFVRSPELLMLV